MALERIQPQLVDEFIWYNDVNDSTINESIAPGTFWKFKSIRIHFSTAFGSVENLQVYISSIRGSGFSQLILERAMNNSTDYQFNNYSHEMWCFSDDQLVISLSNSGGNGVGITVNGWAVQQEQ